ncbi:MAG: signal peptidase I [Clostridiales bacterium]|nr:signal peptidase I [Clostridiales bacterium]
MAPRSINEINNDFGYEKSSGYYAPSREDNAAYGSPYPEPYDAYADGRQRRANNALNNGQHSQYYNQYDYNQHDYNQHDYNQYANNRPADENPAQYNRAPLPAAGYNADDRYGGSSQYSEQPHYADQDRAVSRPAAYSTPDRFYQNNSNYQPEPYERQSQYSQPERYKPQGYYDPQEHYDPQKYYDPQERPSQMDQYSPRSIETSNYREFAASGRYEQERPYNPSALPPRSNGGERALPSHTNVQRFDYPQEQISMDAAQRHYGQSLPLPQANPQQPYAGAGQAYSAGQSYSPTPGYPQQGYQQPPTGQYTPGQAIANQHYSDSYARTPYDQTSYARTPGALPQGFSNDIYNESPYPQQTPGQMPLRPMSLGQTPLYQGDQGAPYMNNPMAEAGYQQGQNYFGIPTPMLGGPQARDPRQQALARSDDYADDEYDDDLGIGPRKAKRGANRPGALRRGLDALFPSKDKSKRVGGSKKTSLRDKIADFLFYTGLIILVITAFYYTQRSSGPVSLFGYSFMDVLSPSMQSQIPQGSLILVKDTGVNALEVGDTITFMKDAQTSWTHQIINIYDNYENTGKKGFQTKGVDNDSPDETIVYEDKIVGRVIFHIPVLGSMLTYVGGNIYIVFLLFGLLMIFSFGLRGLIRLSPEPGSEGDPHLLAQSPFDNDR